MDRVFVWSADEKNFVYQLVHSYLPGTMDTSLVSTDYINNPRTMNAVYLLGERLRQAHIWGKERLEGNERQNRQLPGTFDPPATSWSPRVLKDGADSVGVLGALNRVYINIGLYSEDWTTHFNPFFGFKPITPILIADRREIFLLLARDRGGHAVDGRLPGRRGPAGQARRRAGRRQISHRGRRHARRGASASSPRPARAAIQASCRPKRAR